MSVFKNLTTDGLEETEDRLGGYSPFDSDIYIGKVKLAYTGTSSGGAMFIALNLATEDGREYQETVYVTNRQGENFYLHPQNRSKKVPLPGFTVIDDLCLVTTGAPLSEQPTEQKTVKLYDFEEKKEVPKVVDVLVELLEKDVAVGILQNTVDRMKKEGNDYVPTGETRQENVIDKVFHPELKLTVAEARNGLTEPKFWDSWLERNQGQIRDRTSKDSGGGSKGKPPTPTAGGTGRAPRESLFGKK